MAPNKVFTIPDIQASDILLDADLRNTRALLSLFGEEIKTLHHAGTKFIFVIDVTSFPKIHCRIDTQIPPGSRDDPFDLDVQSVWEHYDSTQIIVIIVDLNQPFTGLKLVPYHLIDDAAAHR